MSHIPDRFKRGYKSSRDMRESSEKNIRFKCPYCPREGLLYTSYGLHIYKEHLEDIFRIKSKDCDDNRKSLFKKKYLTEPIPLIHPKGDAYWCLGCQTSFKNQTKALHHLSQRENCQEAHKQNLLSLRDTYPENCETKEIPAIKNKATLEAFIDDLLERVRTLETKHKEEKMDYETKYGSYFEDWGMDLREEILRDGWKFVLDEKSVPQPEVQSPLLPSEEDDLLPLVEEKKMTKEQMLQTILDDPTFSEADKKAMRRDYHLEKELANEKEKTPPPSVLPPPPIQNEIPVVSDFSKLTQWERVVKANPNLTLQEQIQFATQRGIQPDNHMDFKIISNTKIKRPPKTATQ